MWNQVYDPFGSAILSTLAASIPVVLLLVLIASGKFEAHVAALISLVVAILVACLMFTMPIEKALAAAGFGALTGLFPIGWIILNVIFLYRLTVEKGWFDILQQSVGGITTDRRLQLLLIAFAFGAFFEGASGFGTPVAVTGALLMGLGFSPLAASGLSLIANTAPVAYGALGAPIAGLASVTGYDPFVLGAMIGRQLPFFSVMVPFWLIYVFAGWRGMVQIWPAILVCGVSFAIPQYLISNFWNPWIVDIGAAIVCMGCLVAFLRVWQPAEIWTSAALRSADNSAATMTKPAVAAAPRQATRDEVIKSWIPWIILSVIVGVWGTNAFKNLVNPYTTLSFSMPYIHEQIAVVPPVTSAPVVQKYVFAFTFASYTGTGILLAAIISGFVMGFSPVRMVKAYLETIWVVRYSLLTVVGMLAIAAVTRVSGLDATLGLAFAGTGVFYPFFGTLLGWLGVALTGSDTASNVLFGNLQKITAEKLGLSPILMAGANSSGGVMGKMIDAQSIVVASTATNWFGHEGTILRFVFWHSIGLACLVGLFVTLQAYVPPFTHMVIHP